MVRELKRDASPNFAPECHTHATEGCPVTRTRITIALIAKNEQEVIERCLRSALQVTPHIVVVDTGSNDDTVALARSLGAHVAHFEWVEDFSAARNYSFQVAREVFDPEYLMWLDADDIVTAKAAAGIAKSLDEAPEGAGPHAFISPYLYATDEHGNPIVTVMRERIVRASLDLKWQGAIHECLPIPSPSKTVEWSILHARPLDRSPNARNLRIYDKLLKGRGVEGLTTRDCYYYAKELFDGGRFDDALSMYEQFVERPDAWWEDKAQAFCAMGRLAGRTNHEHGRQYAARAAAVKHTLAEAYCVLGDLCLQDRQWDAAIHWYTVAATVPPGKGTLAATNDVYHTWVPHIQLCVAYRGAGHIDKARHHLAIAAKYRPNDSAVIENEMIIGRRRSGEGKRLNLGCGGKRMSGWINCDLFPSPTVDEAFSLDDIPYASGTVEALHSEHALEHLPRHRAEAAIKEWARVLKPGGELLLKIPDLELCCRYFVEGRPQDTLPLEDMRYDWWHHTLFGVQEGQAHEPDEGQINYCGFTKARIRQLLEDAGFIIDYLVNYDGWNTPSIAIRAVRKRAAPSMGWYVPESKEFGPIRIRAVNVTKTLRALGYDARIVTPDDLRTQTFGLLVVGQYWHNKFLDVVDAYKARTGGKVVADFAEDYFALDTENLDRMLGHAEVVVCCSTRLADKARARGKTAFVIEDAIESAPDMRAWHRQTTSETRLKAGWLGYGGNAKHAEALRPLLDQLGYDLVTIHEWPTATVKWNLETCFKELAKCDVVICPQDVENQPCKSANKLTQAMGLALPTVVSPLPAYLEVVKDGETGFVARTPEEWERALRLLRDDALRARVGESAYRAAEPYRLDAIAENWARFAQSVVTGGGGGGGKPDSVATPIVDIIVPTYNNPELLALCVRSLVESTAIPYRVIVVDNGERKADHQALAREVVRGACVGYDLIVPKERLTFSESNNVALKESRAPYVCLLNDDTIPTPGWLDALKAATDEGHGIVGPFSNCDQGWLHHEKVVVDGVDLHPGMKLAEVESIIPSIRRYGEERSRAKPVTHKWRWFAFYCVLMKREVVEKVGLLDTTFKNGGEDADYCYRAAKLGFNCAQRMNSFVFHFGEQSRKVSEREDPDRHLREDQHNNEYLQKKWEKGTLVIYTGPAWEAWSPRSLTEGGIGGSETAVIHMARELSSKYRVIVFGDCLEQAGKYDGVVYRPYTDFPTFVDQNWIDVLVMSRTLEPLKLPVRAGRKLCWVHDIWLSQVNALPAEQAQVEAFLCLSDWHKEFFCQHHGVDPARVRVTRNGIDLSRFSRVGEQPRDRYRFIYSSSPDRGLDALLDMWPKIREIAPEANLRVFYGFDNWNKSITRRGDAEQAAFRDRVTAGLKQPGIEVFGRVSQDRLAEEMMRASVWAYPTYFWETFCITALEAQAAGLAVVTSDLAGLKDSVKTGVRVTVSDYWQSWGTVRGPEYQAAFLSAVERALRDDSVIEAARRDGPAVSRSVQWKHESQASSFSWKDIARAWVTSFLD